MFNAALFEGRSVIRPEELVEMDTDISSLLRTGEYAETVQKILDVVKKSARGVDFVILGLKTSSMYITGCRCGFCWGMPSGI